MGSSANTPEMWPQTMIRTYLPKSAKVINTAVPGSAWGVYIQSSSSILEQWDRAKKQLPAGRQPDIVIITTGGNCYPDSKYGYDDVIELCLKDSALKNFDDQMIVAVRSLRRIIADAPASDIYLVANFYFDSTPGMDKRLRHYRTQLSALCDFFSCNLVDLTRNSNIRGYLEVDRRTRIFTHDSVHASTEKGKERIARLIYSELKKNYPDPVK